MPADRLVVSNTSPLLNLALIDRLDLLETQFSTVTVPEQVWRELEEGDEGLAVLTEARTRGTLTVVPVETDDLYVEIRRALDAGETAAITYAMHNEADLVLLDEREGRKTARRHDLSVTGVIGICLRAAREDALDLQPALDRLRQAGFWISDDLYEEAIQRHEHDE